MKKKIITLISIIIAISIIVLYIYQNKNNDQYGLIELTGQELTNYILSEKNPSITFALYNDRDVQAEDFFKDLEKTSKTAHQNIYYVNSNHVTFEFEEIMAALANATVKTLAYYVIQDGNLIVSNTYSNFNTMYEDLNGKKYDSQVKKMSKEEKIEYIEKAREAYKDGDISSAFNYLSNAYDIEEGKEEWNNNKYYKLFGSWEYFNIRPDGKTLDYKNIYIVPFMSYVYYIESIEEIEGYEQPPANEYTTYETKIQDDIIYVLNEKNNKYEKKFEIISINKFSITLKVGKNTYEFQYGY